MSDAVAMTPGQERIERSTRLVPASPQEIFDLLADPRRHGSIDGSDTVRKVIDAPERLSLGARFRMDMMWLVPYRMSNEVVEFDEPNLIAWRHYGRHTWRYRLRAVEEGTEVTEEFDWRPSPVPWILTAIKAPQRNAESIEATLDRLVEHFSSPHRRTSDPGGTPAARYRGST
jgi:uncharacterized protein YndB with AHSA1/START domain